ncbi:hypothetical protein MTR67_007720 [Solanum verrucosum]|uniref:Yippee domain-containing protein n=1 Tax=Solanum verrucosum TaxID=315347 RepID=A0AAF0TIH6_SOLVR|nr:hypothetical protein MTR67_007720 [Solanum verrucosum]
MKLRNDSSEVSSLLGDLKQGVADELKEQLQKFSFKEKHRRITEIVESKKNNTMHSLENSWRGAYYSVRGRKQNSSTRKGNSVLELCKIADIYYVDCNEVLRWKYEQVVEPSQKYKEGKFVLELCKIADLYCVDCNEVLC